MRNRLNSIFESDGEIEDNEDTTQQEQDEPASSSMSDSALFIVKTLQDKGYTTVYAGGCVRDMLLGKEPHDIDIASNATPDEVEFLFDKTVPVGKSFGVVRVIVNNYEFEVATFRNDGNYSDGRRPDSVSFSSIEDDAGRRDFTINGMFYDPIAGKVLDFVGGESDLRNSILQFIGNPNERIEEDRLRILRGIRFSIRFGFDLGEETFNAIKTNASRIHDVSQERISQELVKIIELGKPRQAMLLLDQSGLLKEILPEIYALKGVRQDPIWHPEGDTFSHTLLVMENLVGKSIELQFAGLFHDVGKPSTTVIGDRITSRGHAQVGADMTRDILHGMKFSNTFTEAVADLVYHHMDIISMVKAKKATQKKFMSKPNYKDIRELYIADKMGSSGDLSSLEKLDSISKSFEGQSLKPAPFITGKDLIDIGFVPGKNLGNIKDAIYDKQLEGEVTSKEDAIGYAKSLLR